MQSILLTTPSKASKLENSHENKLSNDGKTTKQTQGSEFASVLDNTLEETKTQKNKKTQSDTLSDSVQNKKTQSKEAQETNKEKGKVGAKKSEDKTLSEKVTDAEVTEKNKQVKGGGDILAKEELVKGTLNTQPVINSTTSENPPGELKETPIKSSHLQKTLATQVTEESLDSSLNKDALNTPVSFSSENEISKTSVQASAIATNEEPLEKDQSKLTSTDAELEDNISIQKSTAELNTGNISSQEEVAQQALSAKELTQKEEQNNLSENNFSEKNSASEKNIFDNKATTFTATSINQEKNIELISQEEKVGDPEKQIQEDQNTQVMSETTKAASSETLIDQPQSEQLQTSDEQKLTTDFESNPKAELIASEHSVSPAALSAKLDSNKHIENDEEAVISSMLPESEGVQTHLETKVPTPEELISNLATAMETVPVEKVTQAQIKSEETTEETLDELDESIESDVNLDELAINPILAQIQTAQKTDTKVSDNELQMAAVSGIDKDSKKSDKSSLKESGKEAIKLNKTNVENVLAEASVESDLQEKQLISKANVANNEKLEGMLANFRAEANKPFFNQNTDANTIATANIATASADKLLHQTQTTTIQSAIQSSALQQPLELQAKHAANMVGERIMMMLNQGKQEVTIRLDPAELGSMHIKLQVQQDQLQVAIQTQVGQSRDIIEQNLPRLREQLAQQGINLGEASVQQQSQQNQSNSQGSSQTGNNSQGMGHQGDSFVEDSADFIPTKIPLPAQGIDYYA